MKNSLTIFGCCICTDIFLYAADEGNTDFLIKNSAYQMSPISAIMDTPIPALFEFEPDAKYERANETFKSDVRRDFFDKCKRKKTDYILIDFVSMCYSVLKICFYDEKCGGVTETFLSHGVRVKDHVDKDLFPYLNECCIKYEVISSTVFEEQFESIIKEFANRVREIWSENRIIVINVCPAESMITDKGTISKLIYSRSETNTNRIKAGYELFIRECPGCHTIEPLTTMISSWDLKWMPAPFHYHKDYYKYLYNCIDVITDGNEQNEERKLLNDLNCEYSKILLEKVLKAYEETARQFDDVKLKYSFEIGRGQQLNATGDFLDNLNSFYGFGNTFYSSLNTILLRKAKNLNDYIKTLCCIKNDAFLIFGSVADTADKYWNKWENRDLLGIQADMKLRMSYLFFSDLEHQDIYEAIDEDSHEIRYQLFFRNDFAYFRNEYVVDLISKGKSVNTKSSEMVQYSKIIINNIDYSINKRGLNIVVFSKKENQVIDSFYVDFWNDKKLAIRRK